MSASEDEIRKLLARVENVATANQQTIQEMIAITRGLGSTIRGPLPPRMDELQSKLQSGVPELGAALNDLRAAYDR